MKIATISVVGLLFAAGCASDKSENQSTPSHPQTQIDLSQPPYVYIAGEVRVGGKYAWTNGMTLADTLKAAGGLSAFATHRVRVNHSDGTTDTYRLDSKMHPTNNPPVFPGDMIYSPRGGIF